MHSDQVRKTMKTTRASYCYLQVVEITGFGKNPCRRTRRIRVSKARMEQIRQMERDTAHFLRIVATAHRNAHKKPLQIH